MELIRQSGSRDLRVDFFRGLALWWIYTDHIPGDILANVSLRNFAMCDATEVFVLLAGYGAGLSYGQRLPSAGYISTAADVLRRAWTLYIVHIFLFMLFTAQVAYSATVMNRLDYLADTRLDVLGDDPYRSILEALLLRFQPNLLNILPLYIALMVFFAATIWLLRWPRAFFGLSLGLYLLVRVTSLNLPGWMDDSWYFDPFAWQFLFSIGVLLACAPVRMPSRPRLFDVLSVIVLVAGVTVSLVIDPRTELFEWFSNSVFSYLVTEDKTGLHPFRLVSILSLTWLCVRVVRFDQPWLRARWAAPFTLVGQNSLPVFCSGIMIGFVARLCLEYDDTAATQTGVNLMGAVGMVAVGALAAWYRVKERPSRRRSAEPDALRAATVGMVLGDRTTPAAASVVGVPEAAGRLASDTLPRTAR